VSRTGQYDPRLSRQEIRAIRRAVRRVQGINPTVLSATIIAPDEVEVRAGEDRIGHVLIVRRTNDDWVAEIADHWIVHFD
jgi:hypothetical protein